MAEPIRYRDSWPEARDEATADRPVRGTRVSTGSAGDVVRQLQERSQEVTERISREVTTIGGRIVRQAQHDAEDLRLRAQFFHEHQPIQALGVAAGSAFAFGLILGLWRH